MRKLIIAASALAAVFPAAAQARPDPRDVEIARRLPPPGEIEEIGYGLERVLDALMDVRVGAVADAIDPYRRGRYHRDETLGEIASRDDPYARERMRDQIGAATAGVGAATREMAILTPVLRHTLEDAARRVEDAMYGRAGWERDRRYDPRDDDRPDWDDDAR